MLRPSAPTTRKFSDSDDSDSQQHASAQQQPTTSCKRKLTDEPNLDHRHAAAEPNIDHRQAFNEFISTSLMDIDERLWDTYTQAALKLLVDFKRRSRAIVAGAPVARDDQ